MNTTEKFIATSIVDVCGKRTLEYVAESLARFNRGADTVILRSISGNVSKAMEVAQILDDGFDIKISSANASKLEMNGLRLPYLELTLESESMSGGLDKANYSTESKFIEFPIYHLLLDALLSEKGSLSISKNDGSRLITIIKSKSGISCRSDADLNKDTEDAKNTLGSLASAYYRSGLLRSPSWSQTAKSLSQVDDIIIGVDTNILRDAALSEQLINSLSLIDPEEYVHTPNWVLIVVPSAVMHEIEQQANNRDGRGFLMDEGRMGFRALQEILELDQSTDLMGVSLLIVGEANPMLDTRVELRGLREDLARREPRPRLSARLSTGDTIIREQFRQFLHQIGSYKGAYFLTADKSNVALAKIEGLHPIYYKKPRSQDAGGVIDPPRILCKPELEITLIVPIGKLIYELAVEFSSIKISWDATEEIEIACDAIGESLDPWLYRALIIGTRKHLRKLLRNYASVGKFPLDKIKKVWGELAERMTGIESM